jgi:hypothetical protein
MKFKGYGCITKLPPGLAGRSGNRAAALTFVSWTDYNIHFRIGRTAGEQKIVEDNSPGCQGAA